MEVRLTPEQEAQLADIAHHAGVTADVLLTDMTIGLLEEDDREREIIRQRLHSADQGVFLDEQEMDARVQAMLHPR